MKKIIRLSLLILFTTPLAAQDLVWAKSVGGKTLGISQSITIDSSENIYTTGYFQGTVDFDPGAGTVNLTSAGLADIFVQKLNASGKLVWAKNMGGLAEDRGNSIAVDDSGNVYITGSFSGTVDFDPSVGTVNLTSAGLADIFVQKLDTSGNFVWAKQMGGLAADLGNSIAVDNSGKVYTTGYFSGIVDFDPGASTVNLTSAGLADIFVQKLDTSGNLVWAKQMGGVAADLGNSIAVNDSGNVYITGSFSGTVDFDPGASTVNLSSAGVGDIFVQKLNASGNLVWAKNMGGLAEDRGNSIAVDNSGNVYTTGYFSGFVDFDPGVGTVNLTSAGLADIFVQKLDASGNLFWTKQMGGISADLGNSIAVNDSLNVYITGSFSGTVDFDPGASTVNRTSAGLADIFVQKLNASGNLVWAKQMGGVSDDVGNSTTVDDSGNMYTAGYFYGVVDFNPDFGKSELYGRGSNDIFIQKLGASGDFWGALRMGGSSYIYSHSIVVDASGNVFTVGAFSGTVDFDPDVGTVNLTSTKPEDVFIQKLDASGNLVWAKKIGVSIGGYTSYIAIALDKFENVYTAGSLNGDIFFQKLDTSGNLIWAKNMGGEFYDGVGSIAVDASGNVYITGDFWGTVDFDPGVGTVSLTSAGSRDIFILKLDASGNIVWAKDIGGAGYDYGISIAVDISGNVYTTGIFQETADFDPGVGTLNFTSIGYGDIFVQKLDTSGNLVWAKQMIGTVRGIGNSIAVDASGNVYTTGYFSGTVDFDPGSSTLKLTSAGNNDEIFVQKLDASGNLLWAKQMGGASSGGNGYCIAVDASGNVYTTGYFYGTIDFNPGAGTANLTSAGLEDIFVQKLSASGNLLGAIQMGGKNGDIGRSIAVDVDNLYITGSFSGTADFDPGAGTVNLEPVGSLDIFVQKLKQNITSQLVTSVAAEENVSSLSVFPNPSSGSFTINLGELETAQINITDVTGRLVYSDKKSQSHMLNISLNEPAGMYFVNIISVGRSVVLRLMKN
jgi:hypothetical protein